MINHRNHKALLLLGVFIFSTLFQPLHILWHHSQDNSHEHTICHKKLSPTDSTTKHDEVSEKEETCLICDFKFSINNSPKVFFSLSAIPSIDCIFNQLDKQQQYKQVFSDKTPRAPPILIS